MLSHAVPEAAPLRRAAADLEEVVARCLPRQGPTPRRVA
jgi:hypothetical protein